MAEKFESISLIEKAVDRRTFGSEILDLPNEDLSQLNREIKTRIDQIYPEFPELSLPPGKRDLRNVYKQLEAEVEGRLNYPDYGYHSDHPEKAEKAGRIIDDFVRSKEIPLWLTAPHPESWITHIEIDYYDQQPAFENAGILKVCFFDTEEGIRKFLKQNIPDLILYANQVELTIHNEFSFGKSSIRPYYPMLSILDEATPNFTTALNRARELTRRPNLAHSPSLIFVNTYNGVDENGITVNCLEDIEKNIRFIEGELKKANHEE